MAGAPQDILSYLSNFSDVATSGRYFVLFGKLPTLLSNYGYTTTDMHSLGYQCEAAELPGRALATFETRTYGPNIKYPYQSVYPDLTLQFYCTGNPTTLLSGILTPLIGGAVGNAIGGSVGRVAGQLVSSAANGILNTVSNSIGQALGGGNSPLGGIIGDLFGSGQKQGLWEKRFFDDWQESINPSDYKDNISGQTPAYNFNYKEDYATDITIAHYDTQGNPTYTAQYIDAFPYVVNHIPVTWADDSIMRMQIVFAYKRWTRVSNIGLAGLLNTLTNQSASLIGSEITQLTGSPLIGNKAGATFGNLLTTIL